MRTHTTLRTLDFDEALHHAGSTGAFVDLRPIDEYLDVHIPGSIPLLYERGPGMASRARDCVPLDLELVIDQPSGMTDDDVANAAGALRGKGFAVPGKVVDAINRWARARSAPASTEILEGPEQPDGT
ncbi:MAG: rhodanese-like domain-containing protein, partial [Actinomycetota bacterium]|nr:rhodanese-like domain-containing protein [Actinomycetota bacterium]